MSSQTILPSPDPVAPSRRIADGARRSSTPVSDAKPGGEIARILGLYLPVSVTLAEKEMSIQSILGMKVGTILEFDLPADSEMILNVSNRAIGRGLPVKVGESFGLRISRIDRLPDRIGAMGGPREP